MLAAALPASAQTPQDCILVRFTTYNQSSATTLDPTGGSVTAEVDFIQAPPSGTSVTLTGPGGTISALVRQVDGSFIFSQNFASTAARDAAFPVGSYTAKVSGGAGAAASSTTFSATFGSDVAPVLITNFLSLQSVASGQFHVQWAAIPGASPNDAIEVEADDSSGNTLASADPASAVGPGDALLILTAVPPGGTATGLLSYAKAATSTVGGVGVATGSGFSVTFPITFTPAAGGDSVAPVFSTQPISAIAEAGSTVSLSATVAGASSYQWMKGATAIAGATASSLTLKSVQASDSGAYALVATNPNGSTLSSPAEVTVPDSLSVSTLAGNLSGGSGDGTGTAALFRNPTGIAVDSSGNVFVADTGNYAIRKITPAGLVTTLAGTLGSPGKADGAGSAARFGLPLGLAIDSAGNLYVADLDNQEVRRVSPSGVTTTLPGTFAGPSDVAVDPSGNVYVACSNDNTLRVISPSGAVSLVAGSPNSFQYNDGTGAAAGFDAPVRVTIDNSGTLYVIERDPGRIRRVTPGGVVTSLYSSFPSWPFFPISGLATDATGDFWVTTALGIDEIHPDGTVVALAGTSTGGGPPADGTGAGASFFTPYGIAFGPGGIVYITDSGNNVVRSAKVVPGNPLSVPWTAAAQTIAQGSTAYLEGPSIQGGLQWLLNGVPILGATLPTYKISGAKASDAGSYAVMVTSGGSAATTSPMSISVSGTSDVGRLTAVSVRSSAGAGPLTLITGFVVGGEGTSGNLGTLVRASGPALAPFGVSGVLMDPQLQLFSTSPSNALLLTDNGWGGASAIGSAAAAAGAFPWTNSSSHDSAALANLPAGSYSANITGASGDSGVVLAEIYDMTPAGTYAPSKPRLISISVRSAAGTGGATLIGGFVIGGSTSRSVLIRASGPALTSFGVTGTLPDPYLQLYSSSGQLLASNYGWAGDYLVSAAASSVGAFAWQFNSSADSALITTLPPGAYTAQVSSGKGASGIALIEVYEVP